MDGTESRDALHAQDEEQHIYSGMITWPELDLSNEYSIFDAV